MYDLTILPVYQLKSAALDWAIAKCEGLPIRRDPMGFLSGPQSGFWIWDERNGKLRSTYMLIGEGYSPSSNWTQAGPLIEKYAIFPSRCCGSPEDNPEIFQAGKDLNRMRGETPLIATMRAIVASNLGQDIEVPNSLLECCK